MKATLVLVHGIDGSGAGARDMATRMFGDAYRIVTYDMLGRGKDLSAERPDHSIDAYVAQLRGVVGEASVFLVGYSMGGAVAAAFALKHPRSVKRLALICPAGRLSGTGRASARMLPFGAWRMVVPPVLLDRMRASYEGVARYRGLVESKRRLYSDDRFLRVLYETFRQFPLHDLDLSAVRVPTLIISASEDAVVHPRAVADMAEALGGHASLKRFRGTHALPFRRPKTVGRCIRAFMDADFVR